MWYNQTDLTRAFTVKFPDQVFLTANDADKSPFRDWEWLTEVPQWYKNAHPDQFPEEN